MRVRTRLCTIGRSGLLHHYDWMRRRCIVDGIEKAGRQNVMRLLTFRNQGIRVSTWCWGWVNRRLIPKVSEECPLVYPRDIVSRWIWLCYSSPIFEGTPHLHGSMLVFVRQNVEITGVLSGFSYQNVRIAILWLPHSEPVIRDQSFAWIVSGPHLIFWFLLGLWISERIWFLLVCTICESETGIQSSRNYHSLEFPRLARLVTSSLIWINSALSSPIVELSWEMVSTLVTTNVKSTISDISVAKSSTSLLSVSCCFNNYAKSHPTAPIDRTEMYILSKVDLCMKAIFWQPGGSINRTLLSDLTIHDPVKIVYIPPQSHR